MGRLALVILLTAWALGVPVARAQTDNPVFLDDSPIAADTLRRLDDLIAIESWSEAARVLQHLLDGEGDRVLPSVDDPDLFVPVRRVVHERLLATPALLERYRDAENDAARQLVESGDVDAAERTRLLTPWGFEAALRVAQVRLESAQFRASAAALEQLERHPDRTGEGGADAARLLAQVARYLDDDAVSERAQRWASEAGVQLLGLAPIAPPPSVDPPVSAALDAQVAPEIDLGALGREPLRSEPLSPIDSRVIDAPSELHDQRPDERTRQRTFAWSMPTAVGDVLYVSDGVTVSAWDRFTLSPIWRRRIGPPIGQGSRDRWVEATRQRLGQSLEDSASVTIAGDMLLTTSGMARGGRREDGGDVVALDRHTGQILWRADVAQLDENLQDTSVRGPVLVEGGTVVLSVRKSVRTRRLLSEYFVGLDLRDGSLRWSRLVASAGSLPFQQVGEVAEGGVAWRGVVVRADEIGSVEAVDAGTGAPLWARRFPPAAMYRPSSTPPWTTCKPVVDGDSVILISPDHTHILRLDIRTGAILARRDAAELGSPDYLVRVGGTLAAVSADHVAFVDVRRFHADPPRLSNPIDPAIVSGRATPSGANLLLPTHEGVVVYDPMRPRDPRRVPLDLTGNLLVLEGQLVAVGEFEAHSYLEWKVASSLLEERMRRSPDDPSPAATLAELAFRAGEHERIAPAVDNALRALRGAGDDPAAARVSDRLFRSLLAMVQGEPGDAGEPTITSLAVRRELIDRLGRLAVAPEQRVAHLMALGRLRDRLGDAKGSIDAYQSVLADPALSGATWRGAELAVRAQLEATRRVGDVVRRHGHDAYKAYDAEARIESGLAQDTDGAALAELARRYPAATVTPSLWARAAEVYERAGRPHASERALRSALSAAELLDQGGAPIPAPELGEIVGRLATSLARRASGDAAAALVADATRQRPGLVPTRDGAPIDLAALAEQPSHGRLPVITARLSTSENPQVLAGVPIEPLDPSPSAPTDRAVLVSATRSELSLVVAEADGVRVAWSTPTDPDARVVRLDQSGVFLHAGEGGEGVFTKLAPEDGHVLWSVGPIGRALSPLSDRAPDAGGGPVGAQRFESPLDGAVSPDALVMALDDQTLVVCDRLGRVVAYDLTTGDELWTRRSRLSWVHDMDVGAGLVAVGGVSPGGDADGRWTPAIEALDARTGEVISPIEGVSSEVRWVRVAESGDLIAGLAGAVVSLNVVEGRVNWVTSSRATDGSRGAWILADRMVVMDADSELWLGDSVGGSLRSPELDLGDRDEGAWVRVHALDDRLLVATPQGVRLFDREGRLVGADALETDGKILPPALARGIIVAIERREPDLGAIAGDAGESWAHLLESTSGRLMGSYQLPLVAEPVSVGVIDGHVLIGMGDATLVADAPASEGEP
ncbi:MAG: PQQ-binding-like beta-propeller repeat protein [Phycisphaerales bacterium]